RRAGRADVPGTDRTMVNHRANDETRPAGARTRRRCGRAARFVGKASAKDRLSVATFRRRASKVARRPLVGAPLSDGGRTMKTFYRARGCRWQPPGLTLLIMCLLLAPATAQAAEPAAVHDAAAGGDLERVQRLVVDGADVNAAGADGDTPLIVATLAGHGDVVNYLLQRGADI